MAQETPPSPRPAIDYVLDGDAELRRIEAALEGRQAAHDGEEIRPPPRPPAGDRRLRRPRARAPH